MPILKGREAEQRRRDQVPDKIKRLLRGAARAGAAVIASDAKERVASEAVREGVVVGRAKEQDGRITVRISVKNGWPRTLGTWLEYGTSAHFISVDPNLAEGRTAARINKLDKDAAKNGQSGPGATLVINGKPVGATVFHPGAREQPWLRPAQDIRARDAVAAAQDHINKGVGRATPTGDEDGS